MSSSSSSQDNIIVKSLKRRGTLFQNESHVIQKGEKVIFR